MSTLKYAEFTNDELSVIHAGLVNGFPWEEPFEGISNKIQSEIKQELNERKTSVTEGLS